MWNPSNDIVVNNAFPRVSSVVSMSKDIVGNVSTDSNDTIGTGRYSNSPTMIESITSARATLAFKSDPGGQHLDELCDEVASYYLFSTPESASNVTSVN
jgi:hypothetical protein